MARKTARTVNERWREELIPIPPAPEKYYEEIYLSMQYDYYDEIESGERVTEFRYYNEYYVEKLLSHPLKTVRFFRGRGGPGRPTPKNMVFEIKKIYLYDYGRKIECDPWKLDTPIEPDLIAIDLGRRLS